MITHDFQLAAEYDSDGAESRISPRARAAEQPDTDRILKSDESSLRT